MSEIAVLTQATAMMAKLQKTLEESDNLGELDQGARALDALRFMANKAKVELHHANAIAALRFRLIRKIGAVLAANLAGRGRPAENVPGGNIFPTLEELGFSRKYSMEAQQIAQIREDLFEAYLALGQQADETVDRPEGEPQYRHPIELTKRGLLDYGLWTYSNEKSAQYAADKAAKIVEEAVTAANDAADRPTVWRCFESPIDAKHGDLWITAGYLAQQNKKMRTCPIDSPDAEIWWVWRFEQADDDYDGDWEQVEVCKILANAEVVVARLLATATAAYPEPAPVAPEYPPDDPPPPPPAPPATPAAVLSRERLAKAYTTAVHPRTPPEEAAAAFEMVRKHDPHGEVLLENKGSASAVWDTLQDQIKSSNKSYERMLDMQIGRDQVRAELKKILEKYAALQARYRDQSRVVAQQQQEIAQQQQEIDRLRALLIPVPWGLVLRPHAPQ